MATFGLGVLLFTLIVLALVTIIMAARSKLVSTGNVDITINGEKTISVPAGGKLLQTLAEQKLFVPSACGGGFGSKLDISFQPYITLAAWKLNKRACCA